MSKICPRCGKNAKYGAWHDSEWWHVRCLKLWQEAMERKEADRGSEVQK